MRKRVAVLAPMVSLSVLASLAASAAAQPPEYKPISNGSDANIVVDLQDSITKPGAIIYGWNHHGGDNQQWHLREVPGSADVYQIVSKIKAPSGDNICVDKDNSGTKAVSDYCQGDDHEKWILSNPAGWGQIKSYSDQSKCLTYSGTAQTQLLIQPCDASQKTQNWKWEKM